MPNAIHILLSLHSVQLCNVVLAPKSSRIARERRDSPGRQREGRVKTHRKELDFHLRRRQQQRETDERCGAVFAYSYSERPFLRVLAEAKTVLTEAANLLSSSSSLPSVSFADVGTGDFLHCAANTMDFLGISGICKAMSNSAVKTSDQGTTTKCVEKGTKFSKGLIKKGAYRGWESSIKCIISCTALQLFILIRRSQL